MVDKKVIIDKWEKCGLLNGLSDYNKENRALQLEEMFNDPSLIDKSDVTNYDYSNFEKKYHKILEETKPLFNFDRLKNFTFK